MQGESDGAALTRCAECAYWAGYNAEVGLCRRRAPRPIDGRESETVAHWPETFAQEGCAEGAPRGDAVRPQPCHECAFWMQGSPAGGLDPVNLADHRRAWWREAGRCVRHAPGPLPVPGLRLVWPATHASDACGEGAPRATEAPARLAEEA